MKKFYFLNQRFECWWIPYNDLCIITWINKSDFWKLLKTREKERLDEWAEHWEWFYDRLAFDVEKLGWKLECIDDDLLINQ